MTHIWRGFIGILAGLSLLWGCTEPVSNVHYELGRPYQANGVWFYPREDFTFDQTGLATVYQTGGFDFAAFKTGLLTGELGPEMLTSGHPPWTSDGEVFDQTALMAGNATLQLPAIARLTNLENGRSVLVRINDRGTGDPHRLVEVTRRTAFLLELRDPGATQVRLQVLPEESRAAIDGLAGAPSIAISVAPRGSVQATALPLPAGVRQEAGRSASPSSLVSAEDSTARALPLRLPEALTQTPPRPGRLWVRLDSFEEYQYAAEQRARVGSLGASIQSTSDGRVNQFVVRIGPLDTVQQADAALDQALASGIPDASIVVE